MRDHGSGRGRKFQEVERDNHQQATDRVDELGAWLARWLG